MQSPLANYTMGTDQQNALSIMYDMGHMDTQNLRCESIVFGQKKFCSCAESLLVGSHFAAFSSFLRSAFEVPPSSCSAPRL